MRLFNSVINLTCLLVLCLSCKVYGQLPPVDEIEVLNEGSQSCLAEQIGVEYCPNQQNVNCPASGVTRCGLFGQGMATGCWTGIPWEGGTYYTHKFTVHSPSTSYVPKWSSPAENESGRPAKENYKLVCYDSQYCNCEEEFGTFSCYADGLVYRHVLRNLSKDLEKEECSESEG